MDKITEILVILQEECAEVTQAISKIHRFGLGHEHIGSGRGLTNTAILEEEVGDLLAMIDLLKDNGVLTEDGLERSKQAKFTKLKKWSKIYGQD